MTKKLNLNQTKIKFTLDKIWTATIVADKREMLAVDDDELNGIRVSPEFGSTTDNCAVWPRDGTQKTWNPIY
jgi:hypothetical protein